MKPIYHGSIKSDLNIIKPFKRYTPGGEDMADTIPPRIYATYNPAYAVAHSFPWSSKDAIDIMIENETVTLVLPQGSKSILEQSVCVYTLPDETFTFTKEEETGLTYHSTEEVKPIDCKCFESVSKAMHNFGGNIKIL